MSNEEDANRSRGSKQVPAPTTSSTTIGIQNKGNMTQHNHGCITNIYVGQPPANQPLVDKGDQIRVLLKIIHQNTWEKTAVDIGDSFKADKFPEPNFEVNPQMVESPYFYQGGHPNLVVENDPTRPKTKRKPEKVKQPEYKKDYRFTFKKLEISSHQPLSVESLMEKIHEKKDKLGVLGVVAQAGAGKTTCMRRWARHTMTCSGMSPMNQFTPDKESRFQMVHFLDIKHIPMSEISSLQEFLFKDLFENEESTKIAYKWLLQNQNEVAIFLDGLDQAQQNITEQDMKAVGNHGKANCRSILCNLLTRNLLPGVRFIVSSREHAAASLPEEAWISDVITLTGFSEDDAKKLFNAVTAPADDSISTEEDEDASTDQQIKADCSQLVKSDSSITKTLSETASVRDHLESNWDKLTKTSSSLLSFISIPVFLMFTAIVFNTFGQIPSSVTELLVKVFETLPFSVVIQKRKTLPTVIHKLKRLSHTGMEKRFVIFSSEDLGSHDLSKDDVQDLLLMVPRSRSLTHLIEGDNVFFFCHQILQEFLSACFVVEMTLKDFKEFVFADLFVDHWSVVLRFVCGLLFSTSEELGRLVQISDKDKKQDFLRMILAEQYMKSNLELYAAIYESNDDSVIHLITTIEIEYQPLSSDGAHLIGSLMARCNKLCLLHIDHCGLGNNLLCIMAKSIGYPKIQDHPYCFDFATLNNFLEHIDSDEIDIATSSTFPIPKDGQRCEFDWRNIRLFRLPTSWFAIACINFHNKDDSIIVTLERELKNYFGSYNKEGSNCASDFQNGEDRVIEFANLGLTFSQFQDKTLTVNPEENRSDLIQLTSLAVHWLNRCSVSLDIKDKRGTQYLYYNCLSYLTDVDIIGNRQIESILLDFRRCSNIVKYGRDITSIAEKFQVKVMDLVISFVDIEDLIDQIEPLFRLHDFKVKIHVFAAHGCVVPNNVPKQFGILKRSNVQIESFRLVLDSRDVPYYNVAPWIQNSSEASVKQCVIVYDSREQIITEREKLEFEAQCRGIELTFADLYNLDRDDSWRYVYLHPLLW